jgi:N-acetyl-gamma-glutamyl-phosphate reductase
MGFVPKLLDAGLKVIDFSADYRLRDVTVYEKFYKVKHSDTANLSRAVYGLPELFREKIKGADLVANPGCFPTGAVLAIVPLLKEGLIKTDSIIVNAVTGASGAGKNPSEKFHFPNMNENFFPYGIGVHRHMPEIEQIAGEVVGSDVRVLFQPHVGPFDRGILSTVYAEPVKEISEGELARLYADFFEHEPFVQVLPNAPALKAVDGTNYCHIFATRVRNRIIGFSAIDNIVKGASGQAIQNMNISFGLQETLGLV